MTTHNSSPSSSMTDATKFFLLRFEVLAGLKPPPPNKPIPVISQEIDDQISRPPSSKDNLPAFVTSLFDALFNLLNHSAPNIRQLAAIHLRIAFDLYIGNMPRNIVIQYSNRLINALKTEVHGLVLDSIIPIVDDLSLQLLPINNWPPLFTFLKSTLVKSANKVRFITGLKVFALIFRSTPEAVHTSLPTLLLRMGSALKTRDPTLIQPVFECMLPINFWLGRCNDTREYDVTNIINDFRTLASNAFGMLEPSSPLEFIQILFNTFKSMLEDTEVILFPFLGTIIQRSLQLLSTTTTPLNFPIHSSAVSIIDTIVLRCSKFVFTGPPELPKTIFNNVAKFSMTPDDGFDPALSTPFKLGMNILTNFFLYAPEQMFDNMASLLLSMINHEQYKTNNLLRKSVAGIFLAFFTGFKPTIVEEFPRVVSDGLFPQLLLLCTDSDFQISVVAFITLGAISSFFPFRWYSPAKISHILNIASSPNHPSTPYLVVAKKIYALQIIVEQVDEDMPFTHEMLSKYLEIANTHLNPEFISKNIWNSNSSNTTTGSNTSANTLYHSSSLNDREYAIEILTMSLALLSSLAEKEKENLSSHLVRVLQFNILPFITNPAFHNLQFLSTRSRAIEAAGHWIRFVPPPTPITSEYKTTVEGILNSVSQILTDGKSDELADFCFSFVGNVIYGIPTDILMQMKFIQTILPVFWKTLASDTMYERAADYNALLQQVASATGPPPSNMWNSKTSTGSNEAFAYLGNENAFFFALLSCITALGNMIKVFKSNFPDIWTTLFLLKAQLEVSDNTHRAESLLVMFDFLENYFETVQNRYWLLSFSDAHQSMMPANSEEALEKLPFMPFGIHIYSQNTPPTLSFLHTYLTNTNWKPCNQISFLNQKPWQYQSTLDFDWSQRLINMGFEAPNPPDSHPVRLFFYLINQSIDFLESSTEMPNICSLLESLTAAFTSLGPRYTLYAFDKICFLIKKMYRLQIEIWEPIPMLNYDGPTQDQSGEYFNALEEFMLGFASTLRASPPHLEVFTFAIVWPFAEYSLNPKNECLFYNRLCAIATFSELLRYSAGPTILYRINHILPLLLSTIQYFGEYTTIKHNCFFSSGVAILGCHFASTFFSKLLPPAASNINNNDVNTIVLRTKTELEALTSLSPDEKHELQYRDNLVAAIARITTSIPATQTLVDKTLVQSCLPCSNDPAASLFANSWAKSLGLM